MNTKSVIKNFLSNNISKISSVVILSLLSIGFKLLNPIFMKLIIDYSVKENIDETTGAITYGNFKMVIVFTVLMGLSTVLSLLFDAFRQNKTVKFGNDLTLDLRSLAYQTVMKSELYEVNKISNNS